MQIVDIKTIDTMKAATKSTLLALFCAFFTSNTFAESHSHAEGGEAIHAVEGHGQFSEEGDGYEKEPTIGAQLSEMILGHVSDNHSWDVFGHAVMMPLPCITYSKTNGFEIFSSAKFEHGHASYKGMTLAEYRSKIVWDKKGVEDKIWNFSITKNAANLIIGSILMCILFIWVARKYAKNRGKAPKGFQNLMESLVIFLRDDVFKASIGRRYLEFVPMLLTIFFFILFMNLMGQIPFFPGGANVTGNIAVAMVLALVVFVYVTANGNKYYWKHIFMPDAPKAMWIILIPIEVLGIILKPFVLMLRLFANITAGHIIILGFFSLIFIFGGMKTWVGFAVSPASIGFGIFMSFMELLVSFLQAFVFTLLSALYIGMAVEEHEHHETKEH